MRAVNADDLIHELDKDGIVEHGYVSVFGIPIIEDCVPVVRCKDCIHRRKGGFSRSETDGWTVTFTTPCDLGDEGFCSKGEKVTKCDSQK